MASRLVGRRRGHGSRRRRSADGRAACRARRAPDPTDDRRPLPRTATVQRTDLTETLTESGQLGVRRPAGRGVLPDRDRHVAAHRSARWSRRVSRSTASTPTRCSGSTAKVPAWRDLGPDVTNGRDVLQLERALSDLGYADDLDMEVDGDWTWVTTIAVERWQEDHGLEEDGDAAPRPGRLHRRRRPGGVRGGRGGHAGAARHGRAAGRATPSGRSRSPSTRRSSGWRRSTRPSSSSSPTARPPAAGSARSSTSRRRGDRRSPSTSRSTVAGPEAKRKAVGKQLDGTSVQVGFAHTVAEDVLAVPVTALVALVDGGYGVEKVGADGSTVVRRGHHRLVLRDPRGGRVPRPRRGRRGRGDAVSVLELQRRDPDLRHRHRRADGAARRST